MNQQTEILLIYLYTGTGTCEVVVHLWPISNRKLKKIQAQCGKIVSTISKYSCLQQTEVLLIYVYTGTPLA